MSDRQDWLRSGSVLVFAALQIVTVAAPALLGLTETVQSRAAAVEHPVVPITYAFLIWAVIYAGAAAFAVWQMLPRNRSNRVSRRIGWYAAGMYAINALWQLWAPWAGIDWVSFLLLAVSLAMGIAALKRVRAIAPPLTRAERWLAIVPLGILTGWLSAATCVNLASSALFAGGVPFDPRVPDASIVLLCATISFGAVAVNSTRSWAQAAAIIWALHGIVVANILREPQPVLAMIAGVGMLIVAAGRALPHRAPSALLARARTQHRQRRA